MRENFHSPEKEVHIRDIHLNPEEGVELAAELSIVLEKYKDKRVLVLAPPGSGKSTLLQHIKEASDMDRVFDTMPVDLKRKVLHHENPFMYIDGDRKTIKYTERKYNAGEKESEDLLKETTKILNEHIDSNIKIAPGTPVFGTNVIDTDVIIYLHLTDELLNSRLESRNTKTHRMVQNSRVFGIKKLIEEEIEEARKKGVIVEQINLS